MHHPTDRIAHTMAFVTPVVEHWLEREIRKMGKERNDGWVDECLHILILAHPSKDVYMKLEIVVGIFYGNCQHQQILLSVCLFVGLPLSVYVSITFYLFFYVCLSYCFVNLHISNQ